MDNVTVSELYQWIIDNILEVLMVIGIFVEITPIKINPISAIISILFKPLRKDMDDMKEELNNNINNVRVELKKDIDAIRKEELKQSKSNQELIRNFENYEINSIKWTIIDFSRSIDNKQLHSRDEYLHIKDQYNRYIILVNKYNIQDDVLEIEEEITKIENHYNVNKKSNSIYF